MFLNLEELLPTQKFDDLAKRADEYQNAQPFPHIVLDNFLDSELVAQLERDFPKPDAPQWHRYKGKAEFGKLQSTSELMIPSSLLSTIYALNSSTFVRFLEQLTGIKDIVPDPHLYGGGLHQTPRDGFLKMHIDYNRHEVWQLDRRLNLILYLNSGWEEAWGGALELWNKDNTACLRKVSPLAGRVLIFSTTEHSWHGHPDPIQCPADRTRKSIALYYYTNGRPDEERADVHSTVFRARPGEKISPSVKDWIRELVPPAALKLARKAVSSRAKSA